MPERTGHVDQPQRSIWEVFEEERGKLVDYRGPFNGFTIRIGGAVHGFDLSGNRLSSAWHIHLPRIVCETAPLWHRPSQQSSVRCCPMVFPEAEIAGILESKTNRRAH